MSEETKAESTFKTKQWVDWITVTYWINVKHKLPPEQESELLFLSINKDVYLGWIELVSTDRDEWHLTHSRGHGYIDRADKVITHWMPLPLKPEEEK